MNLRNLISRIFFPERCSTCGKIIPIAYRHCPDCPERVAEISGDFCHGCGLEKESCVCQKENSIILTHFTAVYLYGGDIRRRILEFKFHKETDPATVFAESMVQRIRQVYPEEEFDGICFVPMTKADEKSRGYNQSALLARHISRLMGTQYLSCLKKTRTTAKQHDLSGEERLSNIKGAFALEDGFDIEGATLILCDDVKTTGSTLKECCDVLIKGGAKQVYCVCIAVASGVSSAET